MRRRQNAGKCGEMEKKVRAVACIAVVILLMMMSVPGVALSLRVNHGQEEGIGLYNTGWYIENGQGGRKTVDLPYQNRVPAGQELRISHDIAQEDQGRWLYFQLTYEFLSVYVDDDPEPVYCQETESVGSFKHDEIPVNGFDYIQIPEGKKLTFVLSSPYDNYGGKLGLVYIGDSEADLLYLNYTTYRYSYFIDVFLVGMGCLWFIYGICKVFAREKSGVMIHLGLLALSLGICFRYGTVDADMRQSTVLAMAISRFSGFLAPVFFCGFLQFYFPEKRKKYQFWQMLFLVDIAMMVLLAVTGTFDVPETMVSMYLLLAGCVLCVLYDLFWQYVRGMMDDRKVSVLGFVILLALIVLEFLEGYFTKMPTGSNIRFGIVVLSLFVGADELFNNQMEKLAQLRQAANRREMQLDEVLSQLQPPFLFHALDFIRETTPLEPESAESLIGDFSRFLKGSVQALESVETVYRGGGDQGLQGAAHVDPCPGGQCRAERLKKGKRGGVCRSQGAQAGRDRDCGGHRQRERIRDGDVQHRADERNGRDGERGHQCRRKSLSGAGKCVCPPESRDRGVHPDRQ